jgi:hypothetical protein
VRETASAPWHGSDFRAHRNRWIELRQSAGFFGAPARSHRQ